MTVATIGSYVSENLKDDLEILDRRLQKRISHLIHMLYLEEQSESINQANDAALQAENWNYQTALPHVGITLGSRNLFRPVDAVARQTHETAHIPSRPHKIHVEQLELWTTDLGVNDAAYGHPFARVIGNPQAGQYAVHNGVYQFAAGDTGREVTIAYAHNAGMAGASTPHSVSEQKHKLAQQFFDILAVLPRNHIVHDTAVGLQLPESINEHEWIYLVAGDKTMQAFNSLLTDLFKPFDGISMSALDGRADAAVEVKGVTQHMRSYGDRLTPESDQFYRKAQLALN